MWSAHDRAICTEAGIGIDPPEQSERSSWAPERLLQAAAEGQLLAPHPRRCTASEIAVFVDGRAASEVESRALVDLIESGLLDWFDVEVRPSPQGSRMLAQWSRYIPMQGGVW